LWRAVTEKVDPLRDSFIIQTSPKLRLKPQPPKSVSISPFRVGERTIPRSAMSSPTPRMRDVTPNMDKRNFQRLLRGKLQIDGRLDLHGLTQEQARIALRSKLMDAHGRDKRLILVITGKGKSRIDEFNRNIQGVLRQNLPLWLRQAPLAQIVLEVTNAQLRDGGSGAFYVYLRRRR